MRFFREKHEMPKTSKAIAYLKASLPSTAPGEAIELPHEDMFVFKELNEELHVAYLVDMGQSFEYIQNRDMQADDVDEATLHEIGIKNLSALAKSGMLRVVSYGSIFSVLLDGNFEASLILLDELWAESFRQFVKGDYLIAIPNRDILAFCNHSSS